MKRKIHLRWKTLWPMLLPALLLGQTDVLDLLNQPLDLGRPHTQEAQYFVMESRLTTLKSDGARLSTDVYRLRLMHDPAMETGGRGEGFRCLDFSISPGDSTVRNIPALKDWTYVLPASGYGENGQVMGIDHDRFEHITDDQGRPLPFDQAYHVYNAFVDFHAFCTVFADPVTGGRGVQDLKQIGDRVVHDAAFSKPPTNLGSHIAEGSFFQNGEIALTLQGMTLQNGQACALIGYDSGESAFKMIMHPTPDMEILTVGSSHYWGNIAKGLDNGWVQRADMVELVVSETTLPMPPGKIHGVVERHIVIRNVPAPEAFPR